MTFKLFLKLIPRFDQYFVSWSSISLKYTWNSVPVPNGTEEGYQSSGTENRAKVFSFLNTWSDFLTVAVIPALLATPSAALGDLASSASVAAQPTRGDDVLEDHGGSIPCPRAGHSAPD